MPLISDIKKVSEKRVARSKRKTMLIPTAESHAMENFSEALRIQTSKAIPSQEDSNCTKGTNQSVPSTFGTVSKVYQGGNQSVPNSFGTVSKVYQSGNQSVPSTFGTLSRADQGDNQSVPNSFGTLSRAHQDGDQAGQGVGTLSKTPLVQLDLADSSIGTVSQSVPKVLGTVSQSVPNDLGTVSQSGHDQSVPKLIFPTGRQELLALRFLAQQASQSGSEYTLPINHKQVSAALQTSAGMARKVIRRLSKRNLIQIAKSIHGRGASNGVSYIVDPSIRNRALMITDSEITQAKTKCTKPSNVAPQITAHQTVPSSRSSSSSKDLNNNYTQSDFHEQLQRILDQERGGDFGIGLNDLLPTWRKGNHDTEESFFVSLSHGLFYLHSDDAKSLKSPKAYILSQLRSGFYGEPAGFTLWSERQDEMILKDRREKLARATKQRAEREQLDFELWQAEISDVDAQIIFNNPMVTTHSEAGKQILRQHYFEMVLGHAAITDP